MPYLGLQVYLGQYTHKQQKHKIKKNKQTLNIAVIDKTPRFQEHPLLWPWNFHFFDYKFVFLVGSMSYSILLFLVDIWRIGFLVGFTLPSGKHK